MCNCVGESMISSSQAACVKQWVSIKTLGVDRFDNLCVLQHISTDVLAHLQPELINTALKL